MLAERGVPRLRPRRRRSDQRRREDDDAGHTAVAELECDQIVERTQASLARAKAAGAKIGRPARLSAEARRAIAERLAAGATVSALAREHGIDRRLMQRARAPRA